MTSPPWLSRIETLGTTLVVLMVGSMMIWYEAVGRGQRLVVTLGSAVLLYVVALVVLARKSDPDRVTWWPFAITGLVTAAVAELINAKFLVTVELGVAALTGIVVGTAHWAALRVWIGLNEPPEGAR